MWTPDHFGTYMYPFSPKKVHVSTMWINLEPVRVHHQQLYLREQKWTSVVPFFPAVYLTSLNYEGRLQKTVSALGKSHIVVSVIIGQVYKAVIIFLGTD